MSLNRGVEATGKHHVRRILELYAMSAMLYLGGMFARRAPGALLLDYVPPEEPPSTPLGNALRIR